MSEVTKYNSEHEPDIDAILKILPIIDELEIIEQYRVVNYLISKYCTQEVEE
jgi:hypothetical protein